MLIDGDQKIVVDNAGLIDIKQTEQLLEKNQIVLTSLNEEIPKKQNNSELP